MRFVLAGQVRSSSSAAGGVPRSADPFEFNVTGPDDCNRVANNLITFAGNVSLAPRIDAINSSENSLTFAIQAPDMCNSLQILPT